MWSNTTRRSRGGGSGRRSTALARFAGACAIGVAIAGSALAQTPAQIIPPSEQPGRERERFVDPPPPRAQPGGPSVSLPGTEAPAGAAETRLVVRRVQVTGSTIYRPDELAPLYADLIGQRVPLTAVYDLARRITAKYGADGYVLTRAIVPVQELNPGGATVRIEVVEGYVDRVEWPRGIARYRDFFTDYTARITAERPVNVRTLERYLLLANDLPGLRFATKLVAGKTPGASTLIVEVTEKPVDVLARVDNRGTRARGPLQYLTSGTLNNLTGNHEAFSLLYAGVYEFRELQLFSPSYRQVLTSEGLTAFVNSTYSFGRPGTAVLETLNFKTRSLVTEGGLSQPLIRSRDRNLTLTGFVFASDSESAFDLGDAGRLVTIDRLRGVRSRVEGDFADPWGGGGINQASFTFSQGIDGLGATENGNLFTSRTVGRVDFTKLELYVSRLQPLVGPFSALIAGYAQYGLTPLLAPEQCGFGGRTFGRAFDPSQILGDRCAFGSLELRYDAPPPFAALTALQFYGFADAGRADVLRAADGTPPRTDAVSAGAGMRFAVNGFSADLSAAKAIDGPRDDWRFFFITTARY